LEPEPPAKAVYQKQGEDTMNSIIRNRKGEVVQDPPFVQKLTSHPLAGLLIWLPLRLYLGYQWIEAGLHKIEDVNWVGTGEALMGYWQRAVAIPETGRPAITFDWYRTFLQGLLDTQAYTWFAKVIAYGEFLVGVALIIGAFTGIAAFFGAFMNFNFMLAGSASTNPVLFIIAVGLVLAWKVAGYVGADYVLLRFLGTPWKSKKVDESVTVAVPNPVKA
jgi:thiosulfate dehydrogenase [quinone] large subunit